MVRYFLIIGTFLLLTSCGTSTKSHTNKRGLMLLEITDLPRNAKFASPKYQQKLHKSMKKHHRASQQRYKRAGR